MLMAKKVILWGSVAYFVTLKPGLFAILYLMFYTNRHTRIFIKNRIYDFYGIDETSREHLIKKSDEIWEDFWRRFVQNLSEPKGSRATTKNQNSAPQASDSRHRKVGYCQGWNISSTSKSSHYLYKCGNCGHAGCADSNCGNSSFAGSTCKLCNHRSNFTG